MLLESLATDFCLIDVKSVSDGQGGTIDTYVDGAVFPALAAMLQSQDMMIAYQNGQKRMYAMFYKPTVSLQRDRMVKRLSDGQRFRVMVTPEPYQRPFFSNIPMMRTTLEVIDA